MDENSKPTGKPGRNPADAPRAKTGGNPARSGRSPDERKPWHKDRKPSRDDRKGGWKGGGKPGWKGRPQGGSNSSGSGLPEGRLYLYGLHTVRHAFENKRRVKHVLHVTRNALARLELAPELLDGVEIREESPRDLDRLVGRDAVHQGAVLEAEALEPRPMKEIGKSPLLLVLDQITDPHNVGAIMRSAVAFGAGALITTARHSPVETGVLAKSASGALDMIDHVTVRNLAEAIEELATLGYQTVGLDSEGPDILENSLTSGKVALVLGAEGKGLRQKTRATCATLARIDLPGAIRSLNVSNAAALSLYVARRHVDRN